MSLRFTASFRDGGGCLGAHCTNLLDRYEELVALRLRSTRPAREDWEQGRAVLAIDGLQPDVGHEVLWVVRECLSGGCSWREPAGRDQESRRPCCGRCGRLEVPIMGVVSDGQHPIRGRGRALPGVPHQLCQFHYLREAAKEVYEADRHAKKELKSGCGGSGP